MDTKLSHLDEYKMLREEIMEHMREAKRTEFWGVSATGAVYAWLLLNKGATAVVPHAVLFFSPCAIVFCCGFRALAITRRMRSIAGYLKRIEEIAFGQDPKLPGWERYIGKDVGHFRLFSPALNACLFWPALFIASIVASWFLSR